MEGGNSISLKKIVDMFYDKVLADADLSPFFESIDMAKLKKHQVCGRNSRTRTLDVCCLYPLHPRSSQPNLTAAVHLSRLSSCTGHIS